MKTTKELIIADITAKVEAKLASQKVELSLVDDLKVSIGKVSSLNASVNAMSSNAEKTNKLFINALAQKEIILKNYNDNRKISENLNKELNLLFKTINTQAKDLGININELTVYKDFLKAKDDLRASVLFAVSAIDAYFSVKIVAYLKREREKSTFKLSLAAQKLIQESIAKADSTGRPDAEDYGSRASGSNYGDAWWLPKRAVSSDILRSSAFTFPSNRTFFTGIPFFTMVV